MYLQNKEILFTGYTVSILLLGVQQHLPTHTDTHVISVWYLWHRLHSLLQYLYQDTRDCSTLQLCSCFR